MNVTPSQTLNAALRGFAGAESYGIIQVSTGGAEFLSGATVKDMVAGASALAEYARVVAEELPGADRPAHRSRRAQIRSYGPG
jgi:fructose-bisphosphate aldolase class II